MNKHIPSHAEGTTYSDSSASSQIRYCRDLGQYLVSVFGLDPHRVTLVRHWLNTTFRVTEFSANGELPEVYALRISRPDYVTSASLLAEATWLDHLRCATSITVPEPMESASMGPVASRPGPVGWPTMGMLFRWLPGRHVARWSDDLVSSAGELLAQLHVAAMSYREIERLERPRWSPAIVNGGAWGVPKDVLGSLTAAKRDIASKASDTIEDISRHCQGNESQWGLIHGDFGPRNLLRKGSNWRVLDFDNGCFAPYAYDVAVALASPAISARSAAFLRGYSTFRRLSSQEVDWLPSLTLIRQLVVAVWFEAHARDALFVGRIDGQLDAMWSVIRSGGK